MTKTQKYAHLILALWIIFIGVSIYQIAIKSEQAPLYDPLSYILKAKNFWDSFYKGKVFNPLNTEPSLRPPGTVLMSYPLGFSYNIKNFFFRSAFLPIFLFALSVYVIGYSKNISGLGHIDLALLAAALTTLPLFYQLEFSVDSQNYWGLVDNFLASVSSLAIAINMVSIKKYSLLHIFLATLLTGFCIFIKPSGLLIIIGITISWFVHILLQLKYKALFKCDNKRKIKYFFQCFFIMSIIFGSIAYFCLASRYFSKENIYFGNKALAVMNSNWLQLTPSAFHQMINSSFGYTAILLGVIIWAVTLYNINNREYVNDIKTKRLFIGHFITVSIIIAIGSWFWLIQTGGIQIRYFYPFALIAIIASIPPAQYLFEKVPTKYRKLYRLILVIPIINLFLLLLQFNPPAIWQKFSGINISIGNYKEDIELSKALLSEAKKYNKNLVLYSFFNGANVFFECELLYRSFVNANEPVCTINRPFDWQRPTAYRIEEILQSDYILFSPVRNKLALNQSISEYSIKNFDQENFLMHSWFSNLGQKEGIIVFSETSNLRLIKIADRFLLETAMNKLFNEHIWHVEFKNANHRVWYSIDDIIALKSSLSYQNIDILFGELFKVHAISINETNNEIIVDIWWEQVHEKLNKNWHFFFHLIDKNLDILSNHQLPIRQRKPISKSDIIRFDTISFPNFIKNNNARLGFGIYHSDGKNSVILKANKGVRDWDNHRVVFPLSIIVE